MAVSVEQFRRLALACPESTEGVHQGHADFRCGGRVFATLHADGETAMVRLPPVRQRDLAAAHGGVFWPANGAWGRAGCTLVRLAAVDRSVLRDAVVEAWQFAAAMVSARARKK